MAPGDSLVISPAAVAGHQFYSQLLKQQQGRNANQLDMRQQQIFCTEIIKEAKKRYHTEPEIQAFIAGANPVCFTPKTNVKVKEPFNVFKD